MALALVGTGYVWPHALVAQQRAAARTGDQAALDTVQIRDNVWVIFGAGGNVTVHVGEDGVMLVDSGSEPMAERTLEAVPAAIIASAYTQGSIRLKRDGDGIMVGRSVYHFRRAQTIPTRRIGIA